MAEEFKISLKPPKEQVSFGDLEGATPLTENPDGSYVVEQDDLTYDLEGATELEAGVVAFDAANSKEPSYSDYLKFKYNKGKAPIMRGAFGRAAMMGEIDSSLALEKGNKARLEQLEASGNLEDLNFSEAPVKTMLGEAAELLPFMWESVKEGLKDGAVMGAGFATMGALTAPPTAPITVPLTFAAGMTTGMGFGVAKTAMDIEGGNLYLDLIEKDISPKTARPLSIAAGMAIGLIELSQLNLFTAGFKKQFIQTISSKIGKSAILQAMTLYVKNLGIQTAQEDIQEMVQIATEIIAGVVESNPDVIPETEEILDRIVQTTVKSLQGLAVLGVPSAIAGGVQVKSLSKQERLKAVKEAFVQAEEVKGEEEVTVKVEKLEEKTETEKLQRGVDEIKKEEEVGRKKEEEKETTKAEAIPKLKGLAENVIPLSTEVTVKRKDISGRITKLDTEIKQIDKEIDTLQKEQDLKSSAAEKILKLEIKNLEKEISTAKKGGKKTEALERRLEKKNLALTELRGEPETVIVKGIETKLAERDILDEERAGLILAEDLSKVDVSGKRVDLSANEVKSLQVQIVKNKIRDVLGGIKKGKQIARAEIKDIQNTLTSIVLASETNEAQKKLALKAIQKVQTTEQFEKAAPELIKRLDRAAEKFQKKKLIDSFKKMTKAKDIGKLRPENQKQVQNILDEFSATKLSNKKIGELETLANALIAHDSNQLTDAHINAILNLQKTPLSDMTLEDVQLIHDSVAHLIKINKEENTIRDGDRQREKEAVVEEAVENIQKRFGELDGSVDGMDSTQIAKESKLAKMTKALKTFFGVESYNIELATEILDGEDNRVIQRVLYRGIDDGEAKSLAFKHFAEDFFIQRGVRGVVSDGWSNFFSKKVKDKDKVKVKIEAGTLTMTKGDRVSFLLHMKNENSRRHLLEGGFVFRTQLSADPKILTEGDLISITQSATPQEILVADAIHEYFNTIQKQSINNTSVDLLGFEIAIEPNYFPIQVDRNSLEQQEEIKDFDDAGKFAEFTLEGMGIFKKRVKSSKPIYITDAFEVVHDNIQKASAYVGLAEPLRNAKSLTNAREFRQSMRKAGLDSYAQVIQNYLRRVEGDSIRNDNADKLIQNWINKLDVAILGGNPYIWLKQPVSFLLAATEIDSKFLATSFKFKMSETELAELKKWSPHFRDRLEGNISREAGEVASVGRTRRFFTGKELISSKIMEPLRKFDQAAIGSIWRATKKEVTAKHPTLTGDKFFEKVSERSWEIARRTQPTFALKDRSTVGMSKNLWLRLATKYSSQRNKNWMIMRRAFEQYNRSEKTIKDKRKLVKRITLIRIVAPAMIAGLNALAATGRRPEEDDEGLQVFLVDWLKTTLGDIYLLSPALGSLITQFSEGKGKGFGMTDPLSSNFELAIRTVYETVDEVGNIVSQERYKNGRRRGELKWKADLPRWYKDVLDVGSKTTGMPISGYLRFMTTTKNQLNKALDFNDNSDKIQLDRF